MLVALHVGRFVVLVVQVVVGVEDLELVVVVIQIRLVAGNSCAELLRLCRYPLARPAFAVPASSASMAWTVRFLLLFLLRRALGLGFPFFVDDDNSVDGLFFGALRPLGFAPSSTSATLSLLLGLVRVCAFFRRPVRRFGARIVNDAGSKTAADRFGLPGRQVNRFGLPGRQIKRLSLFRGKFDGFAIKDRRHLRLGGCLCSRDGVGGFLHGFDAEFSSKIRPVNGATAMPEPGNHPVSLPPGLRLARFLRGGVWLVFSGQDFLGLIVNVACGDFATRFLDNVRFDARFQRFGFLLFRFFLGGR
jgi:hypothetical protein